MVDISDIFDTEYLDNYTDQEFLQPSMSIDQFGSPRRSIGHGLISYDNGRELNVDLDAYREMLLQNKKYPLPTFLEEDKYTHSGWVHPAMQEKQEMDIDQLGLASFDFWRGLNANMWNASRKGLNQKGLMGQYDSDTHDIFLNVDANRADYDYAFPNEDWGKYSVLSHETIHPFTLQSTWDDINEINPFLNLDWYNQDDPEIWSDPIPHQDPTKIQNYRSAYDRIHDYLAWNANNYSGFSGYPVESKSSIPGVTYGPFREHHNWQPTKLDRTRMSELFNLAKSWNEGTWKPVNTRKESFIRGDEPRRVGNMPTLEEDWKVPYTVEQFAGNPHRERFNETFPKPTSTKPQAPPGQPVTGPHIGYNTGGITSLV